MGKVIAGMTMSLDGFVADRDGDLGPVYTDFAELQDAAWFQEIIDSTGAVVMGRRAFEKAEPDSYAADYEFQTPIFVVTHAAPPRHPRENEALTFTFVTGGVESAIAQARRAAGDKDVQVIGGASVIQQCLNAGLCNELHIDIMPVLLGGGLRLFENIDTEKVKLEKVKIEEPTPTRMSIQFRVIK